MIQSIQTKFLMLLFLVLHLFLCKHKEIIEQKGLKFKRIYIFYLENLYFLTKNSNSNTLFYMNYCCWTKK